MSRNPRDMGHPAGDRARRNAPAQMACQEGTTTACQKSVTSEHRSRMGSWFPCLEPRETWGTRRATRPQVRGSHVSNPARHGAPAPGIGECCYERLLFGVHIRPHSPSWLLRLAIYGNGRKRCPSVLFSLAHGGQEIRPENLLTRFLNPTLRYHRGHTEYSQALQPDSSNDL